MQDNNNTTRQGLSPRMTIRVSKGSLIFAIADTDHPNNIVYEPYTAKSGVSMAANLREAFKTADILQRPTHRAQVLVDTPVVLVPIEEYDETKNEILYHQAITGYEGYAVESNILPDLNAVALFALNKDLRLVVEDHYSDVRFIALMRPVWMYLHRRSFVSNRRKLYAHFHDGKMEAFSFERNRFVFSNQYPIKEWQDAVFFLLFIWKQLAMDQRSDELYLSGNIREKEELTAMLQKYLSKVTFINPKADFNRAAITDIKGIPLDMVTLYLG